MISCQGPIDFAMREAKEVLLLQKSSDNDREMLLFFCHFFTWAKHYYS